MSIYDDDPYELIKNLKILCLSLSELGQGVIEEAISDLEAYYTRHEKLKECVKKFLDYKYSGTETESSFDIDDEQIAGMACMTDWVNYRVKKGKNNG